MGREEDAVFNAREIALKCRSLMLGFPMVNSAEERKSWDHLQNSLLDFRTYHIDAKLHAPNL